MRTFSAHPHHVRPQPASAQKRAAVKLAFERIPGGHCVAAAGGLEFRFSTHYRANGGDRLHYEAEVRRPRSRQVLASKVLATSAGARAWLMAEAAARCAS